MKKYRDNKKWNVVIAGFIIFVLFPIDTDLVTVSIGELGGQPYRIDPGGVVIWCVIERGSYYVQTNVIAN